jgi:hypothetical protein
MSYISGPTGVGNDSTTPNSTTGDTTHAGAFMQCLWVLPSDGHAFAAPRVLPTQAMRSRRVSSASKLPDSPGSHLRRVRPSDLVLKPKSRNRPPMVLWANHQNPRARPGLPPSLLTRPPPCTGSIVHDFILLVLPPCGSHLVPLSTGSLKPSLLVSPSPGGPSRLKTFRTRPSPATTRTRPQPTPAH